MQISPTEIIKIKALILPKFESGEITGDFPGEAQFFYDAYCINGKEYEIKGGLNSNKLYVKNGVAIYIAGMGKVHSAISLNNVLLDPRFDFSTAYVLSVGCAGSAKEYTVMGDVFIISSTIDFDLGHHIDIRELSKNATSTWFRDSSFDHVAYKVLNKELINKIYSLTKDIKLQTTPKTLNSMAKTFNNEKWAIRNPKVLRGTTVTSDTYWKGEYGNKTAKLMVESYKCQDPYATTEMEDSAIALVMERHGILDRLIIIRVSVNMDVFINGSTAESLWDTSTQHTIISQDNEEAVDIFPVAMENNFNVAKVVIDAILAETL